MGVKVKYINLTTFSNPTEFNRIGQGHFCAVRYLNVTLIQILMCMSVGLFVKWNTVRCYKRHLLKRWTNIWLCVIERSCLKLQSTQTTYKSRYTHRWKSNIDLPSLNANDIKTTTTERKGLLFALAIIDRPIDLSNSAVLNNNAMWIFNAYSLNLSDWIGS